MLVTLQLSLALDEVSLLSLQSQDEVLSHPQVLGEDVKDNLLAEEVFHLRRPAT